MKLIHLKSTTEWGYSIGYQSSTRQYEYTRVRVLFIRFGPWLVNLVLS
jgi:hypothetical protein